jgi:hypothetical protein
MTLLRKLSPERANAIELMHADRVAAYQGAVEAYEVQHKVAIEQREAAIKDWQVQERAIRGDLPAMARLCLAVAEKEERRRQEEERRHQVEAEEQHRSVKAKQRRREVEAKQPVVRQRQAEPQTPPTILRGQAQQDEQVIKVAGEHPLGCGCLMKACLTLGLYILWWSAKRIIVTNRRVIWRSGVFGKGERSIPLSRVQDVSVSYGLIGRILGYGTVRVESAGGPKTEIVATAVSDPLGVKDAILRQVR